MSGGQRAELLPSLSSVQAATGKRDCLCFLSEFPFWQPVKTKERLSPKLGGRDRDRGREGDMRRGSVLGAGIPGPESRGGSKGVNCSLLPAASAPLRSHCCGTWGDKEGDTGAGSPTATRSRATQRLLPEPRARRGHPRAGRGCRRGERPRPPRSPVGPHRPVGEPSSPPCGRAGTLHGPRGRERTGQCQCAPAQVLEPRGVVWYCDASIGSSRPVLAHSSLWVQGRNWFRNGHWNWHVCIRGRQEQLWDTSVG